VGRWERETVAESHPVNPVHPVCGSEEDRMTGSWLDPVRWPRGRALRFNEVSAFPAQAGRFVADPLGF
jgi:hypothetical protein